VCMCVCLWHRCIRCELGFIWGRDYWS